MVGACMLLIRSRLNTASVGSTTRPRAAFPPVSQPTRLCSSTCSQTVKSECERACCDGRAFGLVNDATERAVDHVEDEHEVVGRHIGPEHAAWARARERTFEHRAHAGAQLGEHWR